MKNEKRVKKTKHPIAARKLIKRADFLFLLSGATIYFSSTTSQFYPLFEKTQLYAKLIICTI